MSKQPFPVVMADLFPPYIEGIRKAFKYKKCIDLLPASCMDEMLRYLEKKKNACLVITDVLLAGCGSSCIKEIREKFKPVKIIMLVHTLQVPVLRNLVAAGSSALVSKLTKGPELEEAIMHVQQSDDPFYCHRVLKIFAEKNEIPQYVNGKKVSLSPQLAEVLLYMIDWMPYKDIAVEMKLTAKTAETYCKTINERIRLSGCKSPLEYGVKMGYFTMEEYIKRISKK